MVFTPDCLFAQEEEEQDSLALTRQLIKKEANKRLGLSLVPGAAQFYNNDYLKIPVFIGGIGILSTFAWNNHNNYQRYWRKCRNMFEDNYPDSYLNVSSRETYRDYKQKANDFRKHRNYFLIGASALYMLNMADAISPVSPNNQSAYKAGLYSALVPGLGQIYNEQYWKLPLFYGGIGVLLYYIDYTNRIYEIYKEAYLIKTRYSEYPEFITEFDNIYASVPWISEDALLNAKNKWLRFRNLDIIGLIAVYTANVLDAIVFAHLYDYDVSEELEENPNMQIQLEPTTLRLNNQTGFGVSCKIKF